MKFKRLLLTTALVTVASLSLAEHAQALELSCQIEPTIDTSGSTAPTVTGNTNHVIGGSGGSSSLGSAAGIGGMALASVSLLGAMSFMSGQYSGQTTVYNRQNGGYADANVQNQHELASQEAVVEAQADNEPPRTLCETATAFAGMQAAEQNTNAARAFTSDVLVGELTNRKGGPTQYGSAAHANTRVATTMALYCDPMSVNTSSGSPCYNSRADLIDADINPMLSLFTTSRLLNDDRYDAAIDLVRNVVYPVADESLAGAVTESPEGRLEYTARRSKDARRGIALDAFMGLAADYQPSTQMGAWVESMVGGLDGGQFSSEKLIYNTNASLSDFEGSSVLDLIGHLEANDNYNAYYGNAGNTSVDFSSMTIDEVIAWQKEYVANGSPSSAVGKYQFLSSTLEGLKDQGGYSGDELFTNDMQDTLAASLMEGRGYSDFMNGTITAEEFADNLSKEWASLPTATGPNAGSSYYSGDGLNKSLIDLDSYLDTLNSMRGDTSTATASAEESYEVVDTGTAAEGQATEYVSKYQLLSALLSERYMNGNYQMAIASMNSQSMLLKELNSAVSRVNVALNEDYEQNREMISLLSARLASRNDIAEGLQEATKAAAVGGRVILSK